MTKELDLRRFFRRVRFKSLALTTLLDWRQKQILGKLGKVILKDDESSESKDSDQVESQDFTPKVQSIELKYGKDRFQKRLKLFQDIQLHRQKAPVIQDDKPLEENDL